MSPAVLTELHRDVLAYRGYCREKRDLNQKMGDRNPEGVVAAAVYDGFTQLFDLVANAVGRAAAAVERRAAEPGPAAPSGDLGPLVDELTGRVASLERRVRALTDGAAGEE